MSLYGLISGHFRDKNYNRLIFWYNKKIKAGHVEPSNSPWNSLVFVIEKKAKVKYRLTKPGKPWELYNLASLLLP
jgi:hypothetical protein